MNFPTQRRQEILDGYPHGPITLHTKDDFAQMAKIGRIAAETLDHITPHVVPGISTLALDGLIHAYMTSRDTLPATVGYHGYQHASCISVNHVAVHGIPSDRKILKKGDIVNIDVSPRFDGPEENHWHGDTSRMFVVGGAAPVKARRLLEATEKALAAGMAAARPGNYLNDIGIACEQVACSYGYSIATEFCGHGIGLTFHDNPEVLHAEAEEPGPMLRPGMIFTIEPILNIGRPETKVLSDNWTAVTRDRSLSAQLEHTVGITEDGLVVFTESNVN
ncbi:type I methionyl aminopeptidase [Paremcibacter congregatus]|uniref:type I methionyl aminopeptidase n=1 Tax=Paremcibacter congregatus TaxID=2043170 RepID=UPI0030EC3402|tara:strand:+ start:9083 stop:9913 length:831 start_codon:yes stop_codon:yes gene_type:complete